MNQPYYTRKELADMIRVSVDSLRRNERRWGITAARRDLNPRYIRYRALIVLPILKERGLLD